MTTSPVDRFLAALESGSRVPTDTFAPDGVLDFTTPGWRFAIRGDDAISDAWLGWHGLPGRFEQLRREPINGGELVEYTLTWDEPDGPHAVHHCHLLRVERERIVADTAFCGGQWGPARLAEIGEAMQAAVSA